MCIYCDTFGAVYPPGAFPCLEVVFIVKRDFPYFLMQYYITSVLFVILSWVSFWISVDAVVARVYIGLVTILTLTLESVGAQSQLPRVSYIKAIDVWNSTCLIFAFASLIEFAIVNVWSRRDDRRSKAFAALASLRRRTSVAAVTAMFGRRQSQPMPSPIDSPPSQQQQQQQLADGPKPSSKSSTSQYQLPDDTIHVRPSVLCTFRLRCSSFSNYLALPAYVLVVQKAAGTHYIELICNTAIIDLSTSPTYWYCTTLGLSLIHI